jgi:predicted RNA-binding Zn-ribbon protein involved in translation (DUF1610 family)
LIAIGVAICGQLLGFFLVTRGAFAESPAQRSRDEAAATGGLPSTSSSSAEGPQIDVEEDDELTMCPSCGHAVLIEIDETSQLLAALNAHTAVVAVICPNCGTLSGHVEDPAKIPIATTQGTRLRQGPSSSDHQALEEPAEHDG